MRSITLPASGDPDLPLCPGVVSGQFVFVSGQVPIGGDGKWVTGAIEEQVACVLDNLEAVLKAAETSLSRLCRLHFAAERLNADLNIEYYDPIAATQAEVIAQAANEVGSEAAERVRLEVEAIDPELLIGVVEAPT